MDTLHYLGLLISFLLILCKILLVQNKNLPPSPPSLPIIGHFHLLKGKPLTQALLGISNHYGPILFLRLGYRRALAVSTPSAIEECFTKNDVIFANRPFFSTWNILEYNYTGLGSAPYGQHWRNLRRVTSLEIFSSARMQMTMGIRTEEIRFLVKQLFKGSTKKVDMSSFFYMLTFNIMMRLFAGYRYFGEDALDLTKNRGKVDGVKNVFYPETKVDLMDYFPLLRFLSFKSKKNIVGLLEKREDFIQAMIDTTNQKKSKSSNNDPENERTFIDALLSLQESEPEIYTDKIIKGLVTILLIGGTHTSGMSMTSTVSHLISHPEIFKKARDEIDANVPQTRLLDDADLAKLPYLHCIINESLRVGPVGSIIPLHESSEDCKVGGYDIPRGTMLFVNPNALHKDPKIWADPDTFKPERFQSIEGEVEKGGCSFMPFGLGRRKCPGWSLAMRLMALSLGTLIQCFEWERCSGSNGSMEDKVKVMMAQQQSVEVTFRPREELVAALSRV